MEAKQIESQQLIMLHWRYKRNLKQTLFIQLVGINTILQCEKLQYTF